MSLLDGRLDPERGRGAAVQSERSAPRAGLATGADDLAWWRGLPEADRTAEGGWSTNQDLLAAAFADRTMVATIDLPARLDIVGARLLCMRGRKAPGLDLLVGHTLFTYYASSVEPAVAGRAASLMCGDGGGVVHGLLGVRASRVPTPSRLRYCPRCAHADREARGFA